MTDPQIIAEIAAQHALLLELTNQQRSTLAVVSALAELVISTMPHAAEVDVLQAFEDRRSEIHEQLKKESSESLSRLQRAISEQLLRRK